MTWYPFQSDFVTAPTSDKGSWTNIDVQALAHPTPPYSIHTNHFISDESGTLFPVTSILVARSPLVSTSMPHNAHLCKRVGVTASIFPAPRILPGTSHLSPPVESRPQDLPDRPKKLRKKANDRPFTCHECGTTYTQKQGLNRHLREKHKPDVCLYCDFKWGRTYEYRAHLEKHHPDVNHDVVLGKPAGSRCRSACFARDRSQVSLPTIKHGRWGITRCPPTVVKTLSVAPPLPGMTYVPEPESTQPLMTNIFEGLPAQSIRPDASMIPSNSVNHQLLMGHGRPNCTLADLVPRIDPGRQGPVAAVVGGNQATLPLSDIFL